MKGSDIAKALGKQTPKDDDAESEEDGSEYGAAIDDIVSGLGVEAKDRGALESGLRALVAKCMRDEEGTPEKKKPGLAVVLGGKSK